MRGAARYLGEGHALIAPRDNVAGARDVNGCLVFAAAHRAGGEDFEQLRVQRPAIKLKYQFGNFRSNGKHSGKALLRILGIRLVVSNSNPFEMARACCVAMPHIISRGWRTLKG